MCEDFFPNLVDKRIYYQKQHNCRPPYFSLYPRLKIKLKGPHFDTIEWSRQNRRRSWTASQNTVFRINLKHDRSYGNGVYARKGTTSKVTVQQSRKLWIDLGNNGSPRNNTWGCGVISSAWGSSKISRYCENAKNFRVSYNQLIFWRNKWQKFPQERTYNRSSQINYKQFKVYVVCKPVLNKLFST
jgi:hypothetical protein